jgi:hypothetical protein
MKKTIIISSFITLLYSFNLHSHFLDQNAYDLSYQGGVNAYMVNQVARQERLQLMQERERIQSEKDYILRKKIEKETNYYNNIISKISYDSSHPTLTIPENLKKVFTRTSTMHISGDGYIRCVFKRKFSRVLSGGDLVEWVWTLELTNVTPRNFIFSDVSINLPSSKFEIQLVDESGFSLSSCVIYKSLYLERNKQVWLEGKWIIPYDQISNVYDYTFGINNY